MQVLDLDCPACLPLKVARLDTSSPGLLYPFLRYSERKSLTTSAKEKFSLPPISTSLFRMAAYGLSIDMLIWKKSSHISKLPSIPECLISVSIRVQASNH
ncbi:hypothetical protein I7I48_06515 [Histoplasma ohiense]|nr:hypothetical protein I7I48_06515 [Histoplasma ohiense (nom. inval.)]